MASALPSWNDGTAKAAILDFVAAVTREGGDAFVPPSERIAVFDNDGTLWCEQPVQVQVYFAQGRLQTLADADPDLRRRQPYRAFLEHDLKTIAALGKRGAFEIAMTTHAGMTAEEFDHIARIWLDSARNPRLGRPFRDCVFHPQVELLAFLRQHGFKTYIVTGGGVDFVRVISEALYGVPPEQVIGSSLKTGIHDKDGRLDVMRLSELGCFDDREAKVANIALHIGRRPIFAFGNSDGDLAMLRYARGGPGARLALLLHHDDAQREFAYDREFRLSPLAEAWDKAGAYGITRVSMRHDWKGVFAQEPDAFRNAS
jgi:phosphoserine phosphatase